MSGNRVLHTLSVSRYLTLSCASADAVATSLMSRMNETWYVLLVSSSTRITLEIRSPDSCHEAPHAQAAPRKRASGQVDPTQSPTPTAP
eukprot:638604-Prymnesium_polylepis.1